MSTFNPDDAAFVFVVCGAKTHIDTLHFSLEQLKKYSQHPIFVITDSKRNEITIRHNNIIDVETPSSYSNHQASIWLKTSLHKILPNHKIYCYLDSDVIALNAECNSVFGYYKPPITFAKDHTTLTYFSPYAVNCNCKINYENTKSLFEKEISKIVQHPNYPPNFQAKEIRTLFLLYNQIRSNFLKLFFFAFKVILSVLIGKKKIKIKEGVVLNIRKKRLEINHNFYYPNLLQYRKLIKKKSGYTFNVFKRQWTKNQQPAIYPNRCRHLQQALSEIFHIKVPHNWQHWNGGVFVFDYQSYDFLEQWHQNTKTIFMNSYWKVRDQGTLIATVFQKNLQNHTTLPEKFNFIADFYKPEITVDKTQKYLLKGEKIIQPALIHIYHHWNDEQWDVWQFVLKKIEKK